MTASPVLTVPGGAQRQLERWQSKAVADLGLSHAEWNDALCPALVSAVCQGDLAVPVLHNFVRRRTRDGWGLKAIMDDLESLRRSLPLSYRWSRRWRTYRTEAATAFAEELVESLMFTTGRDPLSGLPNFTYLAVHLEELVAATAPEDEDRPHLIVVSARRAGPSVMDRMALKILLGGALRKIVLPGVLVAHVTDGCFVLVLPPLIPVQPARSEVDRALSQLRALDSVSVQTLPLPQTRSGVAEFLSSWWRDQKPPELRRQPPT